MNKKLDYSSNKVKFLILPLAIIVAGIIMFFIRGGFNFDVEFVGGIRMQVDINDNFSNADIKTLVKDATGLEATVQKATGNTVVIKLPSTNEEDGGEANKNKVLTALEDKFGDKVDTQHAEFSSAAASFGAKVQTKAITYTLIAILCILIYIIIRFEWRSAIMAVIALAINVLVMVSIYTITNIAINTTFIAAMLTVVGYSINNTIVIFDRIRENLKSRKRTESISEMTNRSISETLGRTINSTITTLITIVLIYILGVTTIKEFALPLIIGIIIGAYTSIFIASTFWAAWKESDVEAKAAAAAERRASSKKNNK